MSLLTHPTPPQVAAAVAPRRSLGSILERLRPLAGAELGWTPGEEPPAGGARICPVRVAGQVAGWLSAPPAAPPDGAALEASAALVAEWLARDTEARSLADEILQAHGQISLMHRLADALAVGSDSQRLCEAILDEGMRELGVRSATLRLRHPQEGEAPFLVARAASGGSEPVPGEDCLEVPVQRPSGPAEPREVGFLRLAGKRAGGRFTSDDFKMAKALAAQAGIFLHCCWLLEEARRRERVCRELEIARQAQAALLPREDPRPAGLEVAGACLQADEVAGDYYGYLVGEPGAVGFLMADVSGRGIAATVAMAGVRGLLRAEAARTASPAAALRSANRLLAADLQPAGLFVTAFLARYEENGRRLRYASAGHPSALLWRAAEGRFERLERGGMALGIFEEEVYEEGEIVLAPGDLVVIFADGFTETRDADGDSFTRERLCQVIMRHRRERPRTLMYRLLEAVEKFRGSQPQCDDLTVVVLRGAP